MRRDGGRRPRFQRGVAMVEFAIALPLLLLLLLAIAEFGRMLFQYNSLLQASRDASRYAASEAWNNGETELGEGLKAQIRNVAVYGVPSATGTPVVPGLTPESVQVTTPDAEHVQVSITYNFCPVIGAGSCGGSLPGFFGNAIALNLPLVATIVMRVL